MARNGVLDASVYNGNWLCWDVEADGVDATKAELICVCWITPNKPLQWHFGNALPDALLRDISEADFLVADHCKYEGHFLARAGVDPTEHAWFDTMLAEWVLLGNNKQGLSISLDAMADREGLPRKRPLVQAMFEAGVSPADVPESYLLERCKRDVLVTAELMHRQVARLCERGITHLAMQRAQYAQALGCMEREHITQDPERVRKAHADATAKLLTLQTEMDKLIGRKVNTSSPNEMIPLVYGLWSTHAKPDHSLLTLGFAEQCNRRGKPMRGAANSSWPEGRPKLNKRVLDDLALRAKTPLQKRWIELRAAIGEQKALLDKNLNFFLGVANEFGGNYQIEIMQGVTGTHRTSGRGKPRTFANGTTLAPQPQNTPRALKGLQCSPDPDWLVFDADGEQLEFRGAAFLCNDAIAKADIMDPGFDAHIQTLSVKLHGAYDKEFYDELFRRYKAGDKEVKLQRADNKLTKGDTFKPLFGGMSGTKLQVAYYRFFNERYSDIADVQAAWLTSFLRDGKLRTITGLEFSWNIGCRGDGTWINTASGKPIKPSVYNYPIQYFSGGELIPLCILALHARIKAGIRAKLVNTVHDSVVGLVHKDDVAKLQEAVRKAFTVDAYQMLLKYYGIDYDVKLGVELSVGTHVGEGKSVVYRAVRGVAIK